MSFRYRLYIFREKRPHKSFKKISFKDIPGEFKNL